jgi:threonine/homoserine/homoserine lactone efflux protein
VDQISFALRTYSPEIPAFNMLIGGMLVVLGVGWLLVEGFVMEAGRNSWQAFSPGWMWNDRLMRYGHRLAGAVFIVVGVLILAGSR